MADREEDLGGPEDDLPLLTQMDVDSSAGRYTEVVDMAKLAEYAARQVDRRMEQLTRYIRRVNSEGYDHAKFPGRKILDVAYIRKHGIPGRR